MAPISVTLAPRDPPAAVVALVGEHDTYSAGRLEASSACCSTRDAGRRRPPRHGVHRLDDARDAARRTPGAEQASLGFTFVLPQRNYTQVNQLLDLTGLGSSFAIYETLDAALAAARGGTTKGSVRSAA
jgi:hypothetical protein